MADAFASTSERDAWQGPADLSATFRLAASDDAIVVIVDVIDGGGLYPAPPASGAYNGDCIELFVDLRDAAALGSVVGDGVYQMMLRAPGAEASGALEGKVPPGAKASATRTAGGWHAEFLIPVGGMKPGRQIGLDVAVDDDDSGKGRKSQIVWHGSGQDFQDASGYGRFVVP